MIGEVLGVQNGEVILGKGGVQKWPNMAGLSALQSGPKGPKRDQNGQPKSF